MSGPISDELHDLADDLRDAADELEAEAEAMLENDSMLDDWMATEFIEQAADNRVAAGVLEGLGDAADWLGF